MAPNDKKVSTIKKSKSNRNAQVKIPDSELTWDLLKESYRDIVSGILQTQQIVVQVAILKGDKYFEENVAKAHALQGLSKTLSEIVERMTEVYDSYDNTKTGMIKADDMDGHLEYLNITQRYNEINQDFTHLTGTAYIDIFTGLDIKDSEFDLINQNLAKAK